MYPFSTLVQRYFRAGGPSVISGRESARWGSPPKVSQQGSSFVSSGSGGGGGGVVAVVTVTPERSVSRAPVGVSRVANQIAASAPVSTTRSTATPAMIHLSGLGIEKRPTPGRGSVCQPWGRLGRSLRSARRRRHGREHGCGDREHAPGERVLEEARVQERVHEEHGEHCGQPKSEEAPVPRYEDERPRRGAEQPRVQGEADDSELRQHRQRRRV